MNLTHKITIEKSDYSGGGLGYANVADHEGDREVYVADRYATTSGLCGARLFASRNRRDHFYRGRAKYAARAILSEQYLPR